MLHHQYEVYMKSIFLGFMLGTLIGSTHGLAEDRAESATVQHLAALNALLDQLDEIAEVPASETFRVSYVEETALGPSVGYRFGIVQCGYVGCLPYKTLNIMVFTDVADAPARYEANLVDYISIESSDSDLVAFANDFLAAKGCLLKVKAVTPILVGVTWNPGFDQPLRVETINHNAWVPTIRKVTFISAANNECISLDVSANGGGVFF